MDLQVLGPGEHLAAANVGTRKRLLARVHADVVDQLVLGLEGLELARAVLPEAGVRGEVGAAHVLHRQVRHDVVHGGEGARAQTLGVGIDPAALVLVVVVLVVVVLRFATGGGGGTCGGGVAQVADEGVAVRVTWAGAEWSRDTEKQLVIVKSYYYYSYY